MRRRSFVHLNSPAQADDDMHGSNIVRTCFSSSLADSDFCFSSVLRHAGRKGGRPPRIDSSRHNHYCSDRLLAAGSYYADVHLGCKQPYHASQDISDGIPGVPHLEVASPCGGVGNRQSNLAGGGRSSPRVGVRGHTFFFSSLSLSLSLCLF